MRNNMSKESRVRYTILNFSSSMGGQLITIIMQFVVRTVFIQTLGKSYLGIGGLFGNILSMLSLAEMGVGSAITFKLYEPIAQNDQQRIAVLMKFYKKVYRYIGVTVFIIGIALIPLLPILIRDYDKLISLNLNVALIFILYLINSVSSYLFFAYKSALIKANQKEYYINVIGYVFTIVASIIQIIFLVLFKNYIFYIVVLLSKTILQNLIIAKMADSMYPFIKNNVKERIEVSEAKGIFKDCGALFIYKINNVVVKSTDNLVLSAFIGLEAVAVYSNYFIFYTTITSLLNKVYNSVGHSIGNLHTTHNTRKEYTVFESTMFISAILGGTTFVGIAVVADEFIGTWLGHEWIIEQPFAILMGLELFTSSFKYSISKYRTTYGLFKQGWIRPLISMIINLIISVALVRPLGIVGVLIGTLVADWLTFIWYDPLVVHRIGFENQISVKRYYFKFAKYILTSCAVCVLDCYICTHFIVGYKWISIIIHSMICGITTPIALIIVSYNTEEAKYVLNLAKRELSKINRNRRH